MCNGIMLVFFPSRYQWSQNVHARVQTAAVTGVIEFLLLYLGNIVGPETTLMSDLRPLTSEQNKGP